eukprot:CAMPEP_0172620796 /NCGR_PEP_ID=MMETSP1068-20121228/106331_1 /TAXON_ID=35684 /ORGANISM="Pseudopedinella elastica, Strain CCMP716" /LENGTH=320 /DNA_ID=CAMNT_0013428211 /DNA_START=84 /DNA_END=1046 /DNA_ORIENTATION=-
MAPRVLMIASLATVVTGFYGWAPSAAGRLVRPQQPRTPPLKGGLVSLPDEGDGAKDNGAAPLSDDRKFRLVYTCKVCDTRNMVEIKKLAWEAGTVIAQCQGCNNKHLLSDAGGHMDLSNWTGFSNVANQQGGAVPLNTGAMTESQLAAMGLEVNATTGNVALRAQPGEEVSVTKERVSSMGPKVDEALKAKALDQSKLFKTGRGLGSKAARADVIEKGSLVVEMPEGIEGGDMLQVNTATGLMFVNVPEDAPPLSRLEVLGAIEFMVPEDQVGQVVLLVAPDGTELPIAIPEKASPGSFLQVAYPVQVAGPGDGGRVVIE